MKNHVKKQTKKQNKTVISIADIAILTVLVFCTLIQGAYFPGGIVAVTFAQVVLCIVRRVRFGRSHIPVIVFCLWHFICSIKGGFVIEYAAKGLLPVTVFLFYLLYSRAVENKAEFKTNFLKISVVFAMISVVICIGNSVSNMSIQRSSFPLGYSNVTGIFFGMLFLIAFKEEDSFLKKAKYVFALALVLTQSVGAILVTIATVLLADIKNKWNLIVIALMFVFGFVLRNRVYGSMFTFLERILQAYDGLMCIAKNPVFGVGAGRWEILKSYYQSGIYSAKVIHSGPVQIGVNCGIGGLFLFGWIVAYVLFKTFKKDRYSFLCVLALMIHSCLDVTLSYAVMGMLPAMFVSFEPEEQNETPFPAICIGGYTLLAGFLAVLMCGLIKIQKMETTVKLGMHSEAEVYYEESELLQSSPTGTVEYLKSLYAMNRYDEAMDVMDKINPKSDDIYLLMSWCEGEELLLEGMKAQPHNVKIYNVLLDSENPAVRDAAFRLWGTSTKKMSKLGKYLYYR